MARVSIGNLYFKLPIVAYFDCVVRREFTNSYIAYLTFSSELKPKGLLIIWLGDRQGTIEG